MKENATECGIVEASAMALFVQLTIEEEQDRFEDSGYRKDVGKVGELSQES